MLKKVTLVILVLAVFISILVASAFITTQYTHQADIQRVQNEINQVKPEKKESNTVAKGLNQKRQSLIQLKRFKDVRIAREANRQLDMPLLMPEYWWENRLFYSTSNVIEDDCFGLKKASLDDSNECALFYFMIPRCFTENEIKGGVQQFYSTEHRMPENLYRSILLLTDGVVGSLADNYTVVYTNDKQSLVQGGLLVQVYVKSLKQGATVADNSLSLSTFHKYNRSF